MNALGRYCWRLSIIVVLAFAVTGVLYGVSLTPFGSSFASRRPGPPQAAQVQPAAATTNPGTVDVSAVPSAASQSEQAAAAAASAGQSAVTDAASQTSPAQPPQRPAGGGRGPNLSRGLPELGLHAGVVAAIILIVNLIGFGINRWQRRHGVSRAPVFHHAVARR